MSVFRLFILSASLMLAAACGSSQSPTPTSPTPPTAPVSPVPPPAGPSSAIAIPVNASVLGTRAYSPAELAIAPGTTVTWTNTDSVTHTSTSDAPGFDSGAIAPGARFAFTFPTAGTFAYHCTIHPGMVGTVIVR